MEAKKSVDLTRDQKREALEYQMFLKRKRSGKVTGRGCADGRKQRAYIPREDATSPTVATMSVLLTAVIDALEGREVAVVMYRGLSCKRTWTSWYTSGSPENGGPTIGN